MSFMRKILDALNMDNWNRTSKMIEEKEEKPKNLFWDDTADEENFSEYDESAEQEQREEEPKQYQYVLFSEHHIDTDFLIGNRQNYIRRDYTVDPRYYESCQFLHKLWKHSVDLTKISKNKKFFETLEEFEKLLDSTNKYMCGKFNPVLEKAYYNSKKDEILIGFLDKSFTEEYRNALELRTAKGRVARIDHWFLVMGYYRQFLTPNAIVVLDALEQKWTGELMPNLLEQKD